MMRKTIATIINALGSRKFICIASAALVVVFLLLAIGRLYPFVDHVTPEEAAGDDWLEYKRFAQSIVHQGLTLPAVQGNYKRPAGFLYNYFIAGIFVIFGENSNWVYLAQAVMLGISVGTMTLGFRSYFSPAAALAYFGVLAVMAYVDIFRWVTFRLLSENLLMVLLPFFVLLTLGAWRRQSYLFAVGAGLLLGLCVLVRPNLILIAPATAAVIFAYRRKRSTGFGMAAAFLIAFCVGISLMILRNYAVTHQISIEVISMTGDWLYPEIDLVGPITLTSIFKALSSIISFYGKRTLYVMGFVPLLQPDLDFRPHWLLIFVGVLAFIFRAIKRRRLEFWEVFLLTFLFFYFAPMIAVAYVDAYAVRWIVPALPLAILLGVRVLDEVLAKLS